MIRLAFVPRSTFMEPVVGWWNASKAGDEAVADVADPTDRLHPMNWTPEAIEERRNAIGRSPSMHFGPVFRFTFKLVITSRIDDPRIADVPIYESPLLDVLDQWAGDSGRACVALEDMLQRLVRTPHRRVIVSGGYLQ